MIRRTLAPTWLGMHRRIFFLTGLFLFASSSFSAPDVGRNYVIGCTIYDEQARILRRYDGDLCLFHNDGRVFSAGKHFIARDKTLATLWRHPISLHHQLNWSVDRTKILAMGRETIRMGDREIQWDLLYVFKLDGRVEKEFSFYENRAMLAAKGLSMQIMETVSPDRPESPFPEYTHANSFYEIPPNANAARHPAFAAGNYIVNLLNEPIFILDKDLKRVLWSLKYPLGRWIHDVQVLANGNLLIYVNMTSESRGKFSALDEFNPLDKKIVWTFRAKEPHQFNSPGRGGVQLLADKTIFYSDATNDNYGVHITRKGEEVWRRRFISNDYRTGRPVTIQQIKQVDLGAFLRKNPGP